MRGVVQKGMYRVNLKEGTLKRNDVKDSDNDNQINHALSLEIPHEPHSRPMASTWRIGLQDQSRSIVKILVREGVWRVETGNGDGVDGLL